MSSYLERQANAFKGTLSAAATKISNPSTNKASSLAVPSLAPPSPSPSAASDPNTPTSKRKRDAGPEVPYSQPQLTGYGAGVKTQMTYAVDYLKKKGDAKTITDIIDHLSLRNFDDEHKRQLAEGLRGHPRVEWKPDANLSEQTWKAGTYVHRPIIPGVKDATSLLAHLQAKTDASGVTRARAQDLGSTHQKG
ncbi:transcription initiation factor IIE, beta subunit [Fusarium fujikuroi]|nr:transcription initiation factor IIE, beta subunit [Fusarium fujikuroi]